MFLQICNIETGLITIVLLVYISYILILSLLKIRQRHRYELLRLRYLILISKLITYNVEMQIINRCVNTC